MAATINASSSSGIVTTADNSAQLELQTANTTRLTIDSTGNVGIGTTSPGQKLSINSANTSTNSLVEFKQGDVAQGYVGFGQDNILRLNSAAAQAAGILVTGAGYAFIGTNNAERMRIDSSGNILIGTTTSPAGSKELVLGGDYIEGVVAIGTVGASSTLSLANGTVQTATLTSATACTFTMPSNVAGKSFILLLKQPASGTATTATFTGVKWPAAGAPTITATVGRMDILTFVADGTNWYGSYAQGYTP